VRERVAEIVPGVVVVAGATTPVAHLLAGGTAVVVVDADAEALAVVAREAGPNARLGVFVGDPEEGPVWAAAEVMAVELFGSGG
jgi:hypothetical protein